MYSLFYTNTAIPLVSIPPVDISADGMINISCNADSRPLSNITWSSGGKDSTICQGLVACIVSVGTVSPGQRVNYTCTAENSFGGDVKDFLLDGKG